MCAGHIPPFKCCLTLGFPIKDWTLLLSFALNSLLVALNYPIRAAERPYCIVFPRQTPAVVHKNSVVLFHISSPRALYSVPATLWFILGLKCTYPANPLPQDACPAHPTDSASPAGSTSRAFALPTLPPTQDTCCFLLESSSLHAWWACWHPGLMLNVTALQLSFYSLPPPQSILCTALFCFRCSQWMSLDRDMSVKLARRVSQVVFLPLSSQWETKDRAVPWVTSNRNGHCIQSKPWEAWIYSLKGSGTSEWAQAPYPLIPLLTIRLTDLPGYSFFPRAPCWLPSVEMAADYVLQRVSLLTACCAGRASSWTSSQLAPLAPHSDLLKRPFHAEPSFPFLSPVL